MSGADDLAAHLAGAATTLCRCWRVTRRDGVVFGFTDHDRPVTFDAITFRPEDGLSARAFDETTGLSVDNSEAAGILSGDAITETDILAGRYDGAEVVTWLVNWAAPGMRRMLFRGSLGEVTRSGGAFRAELRGLAEALNQPQGRVYQQACSAVLGDTECGFDLATPGYALEAAITEVSGSGLRLSGAGYADRWFEKGRLTVLDGRSAGSVAVIKNDRLTGTQRLVELWETPGAGLAAGDLVRLEAGCDRRAETCRVKFRNLINFRGFPDVPGEDWLLAHPVRGTANDGGSLKG